MEYKLTRSRRRTVTIQIEDDASVSVRAPLLLPKLLINRFVNTKQFWILKKQQQIINQTLRTKRTFSDGDNYLYLGQSYPLRITNNIRAKLLFTDVFELPITMKPKAKILFEKWYKAQALVYFLARLDELSALITVKYRKLHLSNGVRRWGSYNPGNGTLSLSWRLIMAPREVIDYVIIHELCHILQPNHSRHFWDEVAHYDKNYKSSIKWLKDNGRTLAI